MKVIVDLCVVPMGVGVSVSGHVAGLGPLSERLRRNTKHGGALLQRQITVGALGGSHEPGLPRSDSGRQTTVPVVAVRCRLLRIGLPICFPILLVQLTPLAILN